MIKNITKIFFLSLLLAQCEAMAQHRLVDQVKQDVNSMSLSIDNYKDAINKIAPALTHEETKDDAEAWYTAGEINFRLYEPVGFGKFVPVPIEQCLDSLSNTTTG